MLFKEVSSSNYPKFIDIYIYIYIYISFFSSFDTHILLKIAPILYLFEGSCEPLYEKLLLLKYGFHNSVRKGKVT